MIVVMSGCRDAEEINLYLGYQKAIQRIFDKLLAKRPPHTLIVIEGAARGVDFMVGREATRRGCGWVSVPANWSRYGLGGGPLRNEWMLQLHPDKVYGFHHDWAASKGTANCLTRAKSMGIKIVRVTVKV